MHNSIVRRLLGALMLAAVVPATSGGCVINSGTAGVNGHYLGYVHLRDGTGGDGGRVSDVDTLGVWFETDPATGSAESLGVGFRRAERVLIPLDCRFAIIVRSPADLAETRTLVQSLEGGQACAIDATENSSASPRSGPSP